MGPMAEGFNSAGWQSAQSGAKNEGPWLSAAGDNYPDGTKTVNDIWYTTEGIKQQKRLLGVPDNLPVPFHYLLGADNSLTAWDDSHQVIYQRGGNGQAAAAAASAAPAPAPAVVAAPAAPAAAPGVNLAQVLQALLPVAEQSPAHTAQVLALLQLLVQGK